ncbi:uncharacterized protein LOC143039711 isoform X1 [Oratosquilla oratoria]|uniref:uncharacterized protein LOC143039711 isoform X1 n=1 Tax=Oratosquilla oratoria TaxID=337810 RepID=UPI003F777D56
MHQSTWDRILKRHPLVDETKVDAYWNHGTCKDPPESCLELKAWLHGSFFGEIAGNDVNAPNMETSTQAQLKNYAVLAASASLSSFLKTNVDILSSGQCSQTTLRVHS